MRKVAGMGAGYTRRGLIKRGAGLGVLTIGATGLLAACQATVTSSSPSSSASGAAATAQPTSTAQPTAFDRIKRDKIVRVGTANENPLAFITSAGKVDGTDATYLSAVFATIGITIEAVIVEFAGILPGLIANRYDIAAGLVIRSARCDQATPADPHFTVGRALASKKGNPKNIHSYADVAKSADARIGEIIGSAGVDLIKIAGVPDSRVVLFPDQASLMAGLRADRIDVAAAQSLTLNQSLKNLNDPNLELVTPMQQPLDANGKPAVNFQSTFYRKEDNDLREFVNGELAKLRSSGKLLQLLAPFNVTSDMITTSTGLDVCAGKY